MRHKGIRILTLEEFLEQMRQLTREQREEVMRLIDKLLTKAPALHLGGF